MIRSGQDGLENSWDPQGAEREKTVATLARRPGQNHIGENQREGLIVPDLNHSDNHTQEAQGARMADELRRGPVSTIEASRKLDIIHPPSTVRFLRRQGFDIRTEWAYLPTRPGLRPHRVGLYVLINEPVGVTNGQR